jgi:hypothetical protein
LDEQSFERYLKFSDADLAANRDGDIGAGQKAKMVWSGIWRLVVGPPTAIIGVVVTQITDNALAMLLGLVIAGFGLYVTWRGFAFLTDTIVARVAYVTGPIRTKVVRGKNSVSYFAEIGPVSKRVSYQAYSSLPAGTSVHLYYAPACRSLLSVEPANIDQPRPDHPFGPDSAHAWNRLRWSWVVITVGAVGLLVGVHAATLAQPVHAVSIETTVADYIETHGKSTTRHLYIANDPDYYTPKNESAYDPVAPDFYSIIGRPVVIYTDKGSREIIAFRIGGILYSTDWYLHPEHKTIFEAANGAIVAVLSVLAIVAGVVGVRVGFRLQTGSTRPLYGPPSVHQPQTAAWASGVVLAVGILTFLLLLVLTHL